MTLTKDQISNLKKQLLDQIRHLPESQRKEAELQIEGLSDETIESMLESQKEAQVKIFREIVSGKIQSKRVSENNEAIAVLDIKPISEGHTIIIPKKIIDNVSKIPKTILDFVGEMANKISTALKSKNIKIIPEIKFGETIINIIPVYDKEISLESKRSDKSDEDLNKILEKINKKQDKIEEKKEPKEEKIIKKLPRRIP